MNKNDINNQTVQDLYLGFCESEGGVDHPVMDAWARCEKEYGEIRSGSCIHELFLETIRYVVDSLRQSND